MEKIDLRNAFLKFKTGEIVQVRFVRETAHMSGSYKISEVKTGRGRAGLCLVATIEKQDSNPVVFKLSTKDCKSIVNLRTQDGTFYGSDQENTADKDLATNLDVHKDLKENVFDMALKTQKGRFKIESTEPCFDGIFSVKGAMLKAGRWGQLVVSLENEATKDVVDLWSYRHSGVINKVEALAN
jgi:hypothetical protein